MIHSDTFKDTILAELPYWPSISYLAKITIHERLLLENCEHFVKSSNRNRCHIASANGIQLLTIPIVGGRSHKQFYANTQPDNRLNWQRQHWQAIVSAYGKSPFFEYYSTDLAKIYQGQPESLWSFNATIFHWILSKLEIRLEVALTELYEKQPNCIDLRSKQGLKRELLPPYYQVFSDKNGFESDLAALDLLFNLGPKEAKRYLLQLSQPP